MEGRWSLKIERDMEVDEDSEYSLALVFAAVK